MRRLPFLLFGVLLLGACQTTDTSFDAPAGLDSFNRDSLVRHIQVLASDSLQGRKPFSAAEPKVLDYISSTFQRLGLEPGNGNSYLQDVPLVEITPMGDPTLKIQSAKGSFELHNMDDYVFATQNTDSLITLDNTPVVFAGFGIVAPEYHWNDYAGLDVKGKAVLVLVNDPGFYDSTLFKGHRMTYYGRWTYKYEEAARQGAKACIIIHNTAAASYPFHVVQNSRGSSNLYLDKRGTSDDHCAIDGWVTGPAAARMLAAAGKDTTLLETAHHAGFKGEPLDLRLSTKVHVKSVYNTSKNVIAKITGTKYPDEYIIYTAHWDHLGIGKPDEKGDSIYNGALDNASGTAALLEIARAFKGLKNPPQRTIVFISVTAEEQGLLGSAYYAQHPIYPLNKTVAEVNMDVISPHEKTNDVVITGAGQSDLEDILAEEAKRQGRYVAPEPRPEAGGYFRSDHFNFAKAGVPALDAASGIDVVGKGKAYGQQLEDEYTAKHYHQPSDEYDPNWTFEGGLQHVALLFQVGKRLAYSRVWPRWKDGSEFRVIRERSLGDSTSSSSSSGK
ncbi:M28 family metallopeptidase [Dinghuibacter silviterrae]|uniref:Zn-dependent M28 family amino/carboxypeptidase n=1 Tax=Dinghuibacter silviterrae TaxID=1539049 RepID=A0A4R8DPX0_9BACT|nr:M28 family metallopeptidase [Dinghuibacter silviterrae]TDW99805.1 Zn-dependent M28 family amino/carboxypeptidase [Dinghuibacter silviterrae]